MAIELIVRMVDTFAFKWRHELGFQENLLWKNFLDYGSSKLRNIRQGFYQLKFPTHVVCKIPASLSSSTCDVPDLAVCEHMLYPSDKAIIMSPLSNNNGYIVVTKMGSLLCQHPNHDIRFVEYGSVPYCEGIIELLRKIKCNDLDKWIMIVKELNEIAKFTFV